ncbi:MAG: hypothetical protein RJA22_2993 [Verrucomicrobiota bacterium]|jgi:ABC-type sugar transport system ATPase subunit
MPRVALDQVDKSFPGPGGGSSPALRGLTLEAAPGEYLVLLGPSGSGKTTALRLVAGLETPDSGRILLDGCDQAGVPAQDRNVGMVCQQAALYPHLSVRENLTLGLRLRRQPEADIHGRLQALAVTLHLEGLLDRRPATLAGGEAQRVAIGRALMRAPGVLLLDEPLSHLDAPRRAQLRAELAALPRRHTVTCLHVTHDQAEAMALGDRIAVLHQGSLQQVADPLTLYHAPANLFVAGFVGSPPMNLLPGRLHHAGGQICWRPGAGPGGGPGMPLPAPAAARVAGVAVENLLLGLRPEHLRPAGVTDAGAWGGRVVGVEHLGSETWVTADLDGAPCVLRLPPGAAPRSGEAIGVRADWERACWFDPATGGWPAGLA